ncbi:O-acetyl-ADP-ribose deacetylase [Propioniferax innocua]
MSGPYRVTVDGPRSTDALVRGVSVASMTIIDAICGDITESTFDAIVNAANSGLLGGGGVDGAIHRAAGPEFLAHCKELKKHYPEGFPVGAAAALPGCDLPATWVIQTVGPNRHAGQTDPADLAACFSRSLTEAARVGAKTIAFPAISAGVYGWAPAEVASVAVAAVRSSPDLEAFTHVRFVLFSDELAQIFTEALTD